MPKRKRSARDDGNRVQNMRKQDAQEALTKARKELRRALKTSRGFERQKLGKRLKLATTNGQSEDIVRINRDIEALKGLDLDKVTNEHLCKTFMKIRVFAESENLPDELKTEIPKPEGDEAMVAALRNVTSGMYNMKQVKQAMEQGIQGMYIAMRIPAPARNEKGGKKEEVKRILKKPSRILSNEVASEDEDEQKEAPRISNTEEAWEGFESEEDDEDVEDNQDNEGISGDESIDEEALSHYDALIGASSDEESFDEEKYARTRSSKPTERLSLSISPTQSASPEPSPSLSISMSPSPEPIKAPKPPKLSKSKAATTLKPGVSKFLPTLMGGYWSGSESSASDLEDDAAPIRKNRPGQMARRAIWEKKYGEKANHIKTGQGPVRKGRDDGWDAKRGAKDAPGRGRGGFRSGRGGMNTGRTRNYDRATGENAIVVEPKKRASKKDDEGILHPSWQAAKKAKEAKQTAAFQGKRVTFD